MKGVGLGQPAAGCSAAGEFAACPDGEPDAAVFAAPALAAAAVDGAAGTTTAGVTAAVSVAGELDPTAGEAIAGVVLVVLAAADPAVVVGACVVDVVADAPDAVADGGVVVGVFDVFGVGRPLSCCTRLTFSHDASNTGSFTNALFTSESSTPTSLRPRVSAAFTPTVAPWTAPLLFVR